MTESQKAEIAKEAEAKYPVDKKYHTITDECWIHTERSAYIAGRSVSLEKEWISVKERLPEFNVDVLCCFFPIHPIMEGRTRGILKRQDLSHISYKDTYRRNFDANGFGMASEVTHWMPLSPIPKTV